MARISLEHLTAAIKQVRAMSLRDKTGLTWPLISEDDHDFQMTRATAIVQSFEKLDVNSQTQLAGQYIDGFPEKELLAFVTNELRAWLARLDREQNQMQKPLRAIVTA
jgi:hypothetical protein